MGRKHAPGRCQGGLEGAWGGIRGGARRARATDLKSGLRYLAWHPHTLHYHSLPALPGARDPPTSATGLNGSTWVDLWRVPCPGGTPGKAEKRTPRQNAAIAAPGLGHGSRLPNQNRNKTSPLHAQSAPQPRSSASHTSSHDSSMPHCIQYLRRGARCAARVS